VTGILLFEENMYNWQIVKAKEHFGDWFVMDIRSDSKENEALSSFLYLDEPVTANTVNEVFDEYNESMGIYIGSMSEEFIRRNNITVEQGSLPKRSDEIAVEWNTLLKINQGYNIGDTIEIIVKDSGGYSKKSYKLSGILTSYTSVWVYGNALPGVLMYSDELSTVTDLERTIYCYPLKSYIKEDNYNLIYERICENSSQKKVGHYNDAVYDIKPWGSKILYRYMYLLIMVIGVASISYQVMSYNRERKGVRKIHARLGAGKGCIFLMYIAENTLVIAVSAVIGTVITIIVGKIICDNILAGGSIHFYTVGTDTIIKIALTLVISIAFCGLVYFFCNNGKNKSKSRIKNVRTTITCENLAWQTSNRFIKNNGFWVNFFVRAFAVVMAAVMVFCVLGVNSAYKSYTANNGAVDLVGYACEDNTTSYYYYYLMNRSKFVEYIGTGKTNVNVVDEYKNICEDNISDVAFDYNNLRQIEMTKRIKCGSTSLYTGLSENVMRGLKNIDGVDNISYGYYETTRSWEWEDCDLEKLGADKYYKYNDDSGTAKNGKYLFAAEYTDFDEKLYSLIQKYCDNVHISLEDLQSGSKSIVFLDTNVSGIYDDSMKDGTTVNLHNYYNYPTSDDLDAYSSANVNFIQQYVSGDDDNWEYNYNQVMENFYMQPAASTNAAKVIILTDEIKEAFCEYIPEFGQYTMLASTQLLVEALDNQNEITRQYYGLDELPKDLKLKLQTNQISVTYGLNSTFVSTNNIAMSFLKQSGIVCSSYSEEKDMLKERTVESIILYGFSGLAAFIIYILISMVILMNRIDKNKASLDILGKTGADESMRIKICMIECIRENVWCIVVFPISIILDYFVIRRKV
jgi:hypothetical protein